MGGYLIDYFDYGWTDYLSLAKLRCSGARVAFVAHVASSNGPTCSMGESVGCAAPCPGHEVPENGSLWYQILTVDAVALALLGVRAMIIFQ